jgi:hypothetical protein
MGTTEKQESVVNVIRSFEGKDGALFSRLGRIQANKTPIGQGVLFANSPGRTDGCNRELRVLNATLPNLPPCLLRGWV